MMKYGIATLYLTNIKNDRIPYFDIQYSLFDILRFKKSTYKIVTTSQLKEVAL